MDTIIQSKTDPSSATERLRAHLFKGAAGSFVLQVGFAGITFLNAIVLARVLGAAGYGAFANAMAWVSLLTIPATFGFGILLVRDTAINRSQGKWGLLKGLLRFSNRFVLGVSVLLAIMAAAAAGVIYSATEESTMRLTIWVAMPLVPIFALYNLRESAIRGMEYVIRARLPGMLIRPGLLLVGVGVLYLFWLRYLSAPLAMAANLGAGLITLSMGIFWLRRLLPRKIHAAKAVYAHHSWLKTAFPMMVYGGMQIALGQTDIVMLGAMRSAEDVGLYAASSRLAFLLGYIMMASEMITAPIMARLYANGEKERLQKVITRAVFIAFLTVLPFGLILIFAGKKILIIFGHDFVSAHTALVFLTVSRLLHIALGPGALLLSMTGYERNVAVILSGAALANVILNALLIPRYGIEGAAIASAISLVAVRSVLSTYVVSKTSLHVTVFRILNYIR